MSVSSELAHALRQTGRSHEQATQYVQQHFQDTTQQTQLLKSIKRIYAQDSISTQSPKKPRTWCTKRPCAKPRREHDQLGVVFAGMGRFHAPQRPRRGIDPLVLIFNGMVPGAEIRWMDRSDLRNTWPRDAKILPTDTLQYTTDGCYSFVADDQWMRDNGISPGSPLSFSMVVGGDDVAEPITVRTNCGLTAGTQLNLPPGDRVGVVETGPIFVAEPDMRPPRVMPERFSHEVTKEGIELHGLLATEPFAHVQLVNLKTGQQSKIGVVDENNIVSASVPGDKGDPVMIRVIDSTGSLDNFDAPHLRERRLTFVAGDTKSPPVLAQNPRLTLDDRPTVRLDRFRVHGNRLTGKAAVSPGAIIRMKNNADGNREFVAVADTNGSFTLPADLRAQDVLTMSTENPFGCSSKLEMRVQIVEEHKGKGKCALALELEPKFRDGEKIAAMAKDVILPTPNIDLVDTSLPRKIATNWELLSLDENLNFKLRQPRIESGSPWIDVEKHREGNRIIFDVDAGYSGGWQSPRDTQERVGGLPLNEKNGTFDVTVRQKSTGEILATASVQVKSGTHTAYRTNYDGRGGIIAASSIPYHEVQEPYTHTTASNIVLHPPATRGAR